MENSNKIIPPHLNAEVYRTDTAGTDTMSYLDYIRIHSDNSVLIGCSELTGRYWNGAASILKSISEVQEIDNNTVKRIYLPSGSNDGCFVETSEKVLLCEDSGAVSIWSRSDDAWAHWKEDISASEHDNAALGVDCLDTGKDYITVGADGNIKVWDINEMICMRNYDAAHSNAIYGLSVKPNSTTSFVTASLDSYMTLWDNNVSKFVLDLVHNDCGVRCVQWLDDNRVVFGDEAGVLSVVDVRNTEDVQRITEFPAPIHRIAVHLQTRRLAVCCDNKIVSVFDSSEDVLNSKLLYSNKTLHGNYVRGIVWDSKDMNSLHSVGWDGEIRTHVLCGSTC